MALGNGPIPPAYFDAVTGTLEESLALEADVNGARHDARSRTKAGW